MQVIYVEACESGSVFEGIMPRDLNIYVTTASNAEENSFGTYCPGMSPPPPPEYITCLGDLYSVAWMEDRYISLYSPSKIGEFSLEANYFWYNEFIICLVI